MFSMCCESEQWRRHNIQRLCLALVCGLFMLWVLEGCTRAMRSEKYIVSHGGFVGSEGPWFDRIILDVAWSHADINDDDLHHLTGLGPNGPYYFLDLSHNPGITDKSLKLIRELPLQWNAEINLQGTSVTVDGINKLKARFPRGKIEY